MYGGRGMPGVGEFDGVCEEFEGYGLTLKQTCRSMYGTYIGLEGRGEMIPNPQSYCDIDPVTVDQWGIPVLRFHWQWSDNEIKMAKDMQETFRSIVEAGGGTFLSSATADGPRPYGIADGAPFVTNADKNPTLTILALSWRASEYLLSEAKKGNL